MNSVHNMMKKRRVMDPKGKRDAVMAAAEHLFAAKGYTGASMADIARKADVAVGSVYRLFPDKPSLMAALHKQMEERFIKAMTNGWTSVDSYENRFSPMFDALFAEAESVRDVMPLYSMTRDMIGSADYVPGQRMINAIEVMYREGVKAGAYRSMPKGIVGPIAHAMVEGGMRAWMMNPTPSHLRRVKDQLTDIFARAFLLSC